MTGPSEQAPTVYPELNEILRNLITGVRSILRAELVGAYMQGSFALRDADEYSDVDFVVVTRNVLNEPQVDQLQLMHRRIYASPVSWAQHLEGSYIPTESFRTVDPGAKYPFLDNGARELKWDEHCNTAVVRWILREHGIVLAGPEPRSLIDPVSSEQLRTEAIERIHEYAEWALEPSEAGPMSRWKRSYLVLTFCRLLHTIQSGTVATKSKAADWWAKCAIGVSISRAMAALTISGSSFGMEQLLKGGRVGPPDQPRQFGQRRGQTSPLRTALQAPRSMTRKATQTHGDLHRSDPCS